MIGPFIGEYEFLSNFYNCNPICYRGYQYKTAEHAFQAAKAKNPIDKEYIALAATPNEAKRRGRYIKLRPDWEFVKDRIMYEIVKEKFLQHKNLAQKLIETKNEEIIEINNWNDFYWGADKNGRGDNKLGKILMKIREELKNNKKI